VFGGLGQTQFSGRETAPRQNLVFLGEIGAGEANRTPDPNLGKVMLYP
jgi:hypothetical protein